MFGRSYEMSISAGDTGPIFQVSNVWVTGHLSEMLTTHCDNQYMCISYCLNYLENGDQLNVLKIVTGVTDLFAAACCVHDVDWH